MHSDLTHTFHLVLNFLCGLKLDIKLLSGSITNMEVSAYCIVGQGKLLAKSLPKYSNGLMQTLLSQTVILTEKRN